MVHTLSFGLKGAQCAELRIHALVAPQQGGVERGNTAMPRPGADCIALIDDSKVQFIYQSRCSLTARPKADLKFVG